MAILVSAAAHKQRKVGGCVQRPIFTETNHCRNSEDELLLLSSTSKPIKPWHEIYANSCLQVEWDDVPKELNLDDHEVSLKLHERGSNTCLEFL